MKSILKIIVSSTLILLGTVSITAQNYRGSVRGYVFDGNHAGIAGATLELISVDTNENRTVASGASGEFSITLLTPGKYQLRVNANGFTTRIVDLVVQVNQVTRVDAMLQPGRVDYGVTVTHDPSAEVQRDTAAQGAVIENRQVDGLPLDGRNFYELSLLVPGVAPPAQGSAGSVRGDFAFSVNGAREDSNNFLLDGVYNVDPKLNTFGVRPSVDAIREFENLTSTYDASFGRAAGAQVNVVLKSGSNNFHGSAFEFHRNGALDARNYFVPANEADPRYLRNQFGFSVGGPVRKDKTFFFGDYEGTRSSEGITRVTNVPTLAERSGDFSQSLFGVPTNPFTGLPFAGGRIPDAFINPVGRNIAALYPAPNRNVPFANFVSSPVQKDRDDRFDVRVDHVLNSSSALAFRYSFGDRALFEPFAGAGLSVVPGYGNDVTRRSQNAMISYTNVFSPRWVNDARFAFNRVASAVGQQNQGISINRLVGMPELSANPRDFGLSFITVTGFSPLGHEGNNPQNSVTNTYQILDTASFTTGKHLLKFGGDVRWVQQNAFRDVQSRGLIQFSPFLTLTNNALGDLLMGFPLLTGGARVDNAQHLRSTSLNFFINDSFRVNKNLTLIGGLRYEYNSPPVDAFDRANIYNPATGTLVPVGTAGVPRSGFFADKNNFAPRIGMAWTLGAEGNTVIRAGYGIYYDQSPLAPGEALYFNAPYFDFNLYFPLPGLPLTVNNPFPSFFPFALPDSALAIQRDLKTSYMQHYSASVQQQLGRSRVLEVAYVGSKGTGLLSARDINQPQPSVLPPGLPFVPRPNPRFDDITALESRASSEYNSLQVRFQQRLHQGLAVLGSYTLSKSTDDASNFFASAGDPNFPQDSNNPGAERGRSNFDVRNRLSVSYSYDLPFGKGQAHLADRGFLSTVLTGWQTFGILTWQSGRPFTVALLQEIDNSGTGRSTLGFGANDRPNLVGNPNLNNRTPERWFNTTTFVFPAQGTFGNAGRNILDGPGYHALNASLVKNTALTENVRLQIRAEAFNLFNHPNFNLPDNFLGSPTFGRISSARDPRHLQFGVKLLF